MNRAGRAEDIRSSGPDVNGLLKVSEEAFPAELSCPGLFFAAVPKGRRTLFKARKTASGGLTPDGGKALLRADAA